LSCKNCPDKKLCKKPCKWLEKQLKSMEKSQVHKTYSDLTKLEEIMAARKAGRKLPHIQDECDEVFLRENSY